jgi:hypothetical protein
MITAYLVHQEIRHLQAYRHEEAWHFHVAVCAVADVQC